VFYDVAFLRSLDARNLRNGSAEVMKMACMKDAALFELLEANAHSLVARRFQASP
jgi:3-dehydroquinate synthase